MSLENKKISQFPEVIGLTENAMFPLIQGNPVDDYIISKDNLITVITSGNTTQINYLSTSLSTEIQNRIDGDINLNNLITGETQSRVDGDIILNNLINGLTEDLNTEIQDRIDGDNNLNNLVTGLTEDLNTEIQDRIDADNDLYTQLHNEITGITIDTSTLVPYTGATKDVNIGNHSIIVDSVKIDTVTPLVLSQPGQIGWNSVDGTFDMRLLNNTTLQAGQELHFYGKAQGTILNGDVVQFAGAQGNHFLIKKAVPSEIDLHPEYLMGIATDNIANNHYGYITSFGKINGVYTYNWTLTSPILYFDFVNGNLTEVEPQAPTRRIIMASVIKLQTGNAENGVIFVRPTVGCRLTDLDDVNGTPLTVTGQIMVWDNERQVFDFTDNINNYSLTGHTHDDRYYTETETNNLLLGKSNTGHTHVINDVTNLQTTLDGKSNTGHTHSQYLNLSGGTITGNISITGNVSGNTFYGSGAGLTNIPGLGGPNYVVVYGKGTPSENATELQAAYNKAKTLSPSSGNTINVIVAPGIYTFSATFNPDTDWINIISLNVDSTIKINGINVTSNNVILRNIDCGINAFGLGKDDGNGNLTINNVDCYGCVGGVQSFGYSGNGSVTISGSTFTDCVGGGYSCFGRSDYGSVTISGSTFDNCVGGVNSFGYSNNSTVSITSSTFTDCVGGNGSFGYSNYGSVTISSSNRRD